MTPVCVKAAHPQTFAVPVRGPEGRPAIREFAEPLLRMGRVAVELAKVAYGGPSHIANLAILEEELPAGGTEWWLVIARAKPMKLVEFRQWLSKRVPDSVDTGRLAALTPMLQRRLGWGDVRNTPDLLEALKKESRLPLRFRGCQLHQARRQLAKEKLRLRRVNTDELAGHPLLATSRGRLALKARQLLGDGEMLEELAAISQNLALPGPLPALAIGGAEQSFALAMGNRRTVEPGEQHDMWFHVCKVLGVDDLVPMLTVCKSVLRAARGQVHDAVHAKTRAELTKRREAGGCYVPLPEPAPAMRFGLLRMPLPEEDAGSDNDEDEDDEPSWARCRTIMCLTSAPFTVYHNAKEEFTEQLAHLKRELCGEVTFPRLLVKYLYAIRGVVPPCPSLDPQLLTQMKSLWGLQIEQRPATALKAKDLDMMDIVLGRHLVTRCRVCYKPCEVDDVHPGCQQIEATCTLRLPVPEAWFTETNETTQCGCDWRGEMPPLPSVSPSARAQGLHLMMAIVPRRCPKCNQYMLTTRRDRPENRPGSSKVSRKRSRSRSPRR